MPSSPPPASAVPTLPNLEAIKARQQATWADGDFAVIGTTLQVVGESLCEAADVRAGERVLDVACGSGNAALAAARRFADVTGVDYVPALLERAKERAAAERLSMTLRSGDVEALPFPDGTFDAVLSTYGCMFAPDQAKTASELLRVTRSGGRIAMANWTPDGLIGELFRVVGRLVPPPAGLASPARWGTGTFLTETFGPLARRIQIERKPFVFRYLSAGHWVDMFRRYYGPVKRAFEALDASGQAELEADLMALLTRYNRSGDATLVAPGEYLEVVVTRT